MCKNKPEIAEITAETSSLVDWFLDASGVDQMEGGLILIVVVGILVAGTKLGSVFVWERAKLLLLLNIIFKEKIKHLD